MRHDLHTVLSLAVTGVLAGCHSLTAIREHTTDLTGADLRSLGVEAGQALPPESTTRRVLQDLDPADVDAHLRSWLCTRTGTINGRGVIAARRQNHARSPHQQEAGTSSPGRFGPGHRHRADPAASGRQVQRDPHAQRTVKPWVLWRLVYLVPVVAGCDCSWRWVSGAQAASCSAGVRVPIAECGRVVPVPVHQLGGGDHGRRQCPPKGPWLRISSALYKGA